jgi:ribokinase
MPDILVIGSMNTDLVVRAPRLPGPGETISGEDLQIIPGGKGANQAVAAARQGASVTMVGRVGNDSFGSELISNLKQNNVDASHVKVDSGSATGTAIIVVDADGQNSIVLSPGGNGRVSPADVLDISFPDHKLLLLQLEIPAEAVLTAAQRARESGLYVLLNPAPARPLSEELILLSDFLLPNETELSLLTNQSVTDLASAEKAAQILLERGARNVIVTLGANGALIVNHETITHVPAFNVEAVDTTAAGDAFIGGFAAKLLESNDSPSDVEEHTLAGTRALALQSAVQYGCVCGALAATKFGAQPSLPTRAEVEKFVSHAAL